MEEVTFLEYVVESLTRPTKFIKALGSALALILSYFTITTTFLQNYIPQSVQQFFFDNPSIRPPAFNWIVVVVLFFWLRKKPTSTAEEDGPQTNDSRACKRFYWSWMCVWISWFIFYSYLWVEEWLLIRWKVKVFADPWIWSGIQNSLNNLQTSFMFLCYLLMALPIVAAAKQIQKFQPSTVVVPLFAVLVALISIECLSAGFTQDFYSAYAIYFELFSAFAGGVTIALLASRLGYLSSGEISISLIIFLLYALIQTGYSAFRSHFGIKEDVLLLAIPMKIWLFVYVRWIMTRGGLAFYFDESIKVEKQIKSDRPTFMAQLKPG